MTRESILEAARQKAVLGEREDTFGEISLLWTGYLEREVTPRDVCMMMILLKVARVSCGYSVFDSLVDIAGYAACAAEAE